MEYAALEGTIAYQRRELERQSKRIANLTHKLDELIDAINGMQEILNGAKRIDYDKRDWLRFQAKRIEKFRLEEEEELGI